MEDRLQRETYTSLHHYPEQEHIQGQLKDAKHPKTSTVFHTQIRLAFHAV